MRANGEGALPEGFNGSPAVVSSGMQDAIAQLFEHTFGVPPDSAERVAADGSLRRYWRLHGGPHGTVVGAFGPDPHENRAFLAYTRTFRGLGLPVPELYAADESAGLWLAQDLGNRTLLATLQAARAEDPMGRQGALPASVRPVYERALEVLTRFQIEGGASIDFSLAHPSEAFDARSIRWDLNYFKYHFLKLARIPFHERWLEQDFDTLTNFLLAGDGAHFLYRDFQSRNIMVVEERPWFIDYQGGRRGALQYDVAALLYDGKAALSERVRLPLLKHYLDALEERIPVDRADFLERFPAFVLIRALQAMGAYGYRGLFERKPLFLESIPHQARNLAGLLQRGLPVPLPELEAVLGRIVERWAAPASEEADTRAPGLTVTITSFSYRNGYPEDSSGHGGGFVFDCRSLPNPGRSPEFADRTGRDPEVQRWLVASPEFRPFQERVRALVDRHVQNYLDRGFSDLAVAFGCTGGQHRSVFSAEETARHLRERFPGVGVRVSHREAGRWPVSSWTD